MVRLLLLLVSALVLLGLPVDAGPATATLAVEAATGCHCCADQEEGDCCDGDFGACCASGMAAALPALSPVDGAHGSSPELPSVALALHLLRPRDNGPPPTPPPIG